MKFKSAMVVLILVGALNCFGDDKKPGTDKPYTPTISSGELFQTVVNNPDAHPMFQAIQRELLQQDVDADYDMFIKTHPVVQEFFNFVQDSQEAQLTGFLKQSNNYRTLLTPGLSSKYDNIDTEIERTARALGIPEEAIKNRKVFIQEGSMNAFTVSGNPRMLIIVLNSEIIEKMDMQELISVIGHEMGHVVLGHTTKGTVNNVMMNLVIQLFGPGKVSLSRSLDDGDDSEVLFAATRMADAVIQGTKDLNSKTLEYAEKAEEKYGNAKCQVCSTHRSLTGIESGVIQQKTIAEKRFQNGLVKFISTFMNPATRETALATLEDYLVLTSDAVTKMQGNPQTSKYFLKLADQLDDIGLDKKDIDTLMAHAIEAGLVASRSFEMSADNVSNSVSRAEKLASAFAKLAGMSFERSNRENLFKSQMAQAQDFLDHFDPNEDYHYVGTTHPAIILRIYRILNLPAFPFIGLANPFIKNIMTLQEVQSQLLLMRDYRAKVQAKLSEVQTAYEKNQALLTVAEENLKNHSNTTKNKDVFELRTKVQNQARVIEVLTRGLDTLSAEFKDILKLNIGYQQALVTMILANDRGSTPASPRFENFVQYMSAQKETQIYAIEATNKKITADPEISPEDVQALQTSITIIKDEMARSDDLVRRVTVGFKKQQAVATNKILEDRIALLDRLATADHKADLQAIRQAVTIPPEGRDPKKYFSSRIPVDLKLIPPTCAALFY